VTRQELLTALRPYWNQNNKQHIPLWVNALELYKKETGDHEVSLACGSCVNKIKNWLEK
jgi:hypothetical protein